MTDSAEQPAPAKPVRTWRPMVLWTAGLLLVLGLVWFVAAVAVPVWQVRSLIAEYGTKRYPVSSPYGHVDWASVIPPARAEIIAKLGGPRRAPRKLEMYLRSPATSEYGRIEALALLGTCGPDGVPPLIRMSGHRDMEVRRVAVARLGGIGDQRAVGPLLRALDDPSPEVRFQAVHALGRVAGEACLPELARMMDDDDKDVREGAIEAFGLAGKERAIAGIAAVLRTSADVHICRRAAEALRNIGPAAEDALIAGLKAPAPLARMAAAETLGLSGGERAKAALVAASADPSEHVRAAAAEALKNIRRQEPPK